jgi:hypothetical protein
MNNHWILNQVENSQAFYLGVITLAMAHFIINLPQSSFYNYTLETKYKYMMIFTKFSWIMQLKSPKPFHSWIYNFSQTFSNKKILILPSQTSWKQNFPPINWEGNFCFIQPWSPSLILKKQARVLWWWGCYTSFSLDYF